MPAHFRVNQFNELVRILVQLASRLSFGGFLLGGPCGVGKTTLGIRLAKKLNMVCIDHDEMKSKVGESFLHCSVSRLDLYKCLLKTLELGGHPKTFIFAPGGDSIFRPGADNLDRLAQINQVKDEFGLITVVLTAEEEKLRRRFLLTESRKPDGFDAIWENWQNIELPHWALCADCFIDTSDLALPQEIGASHPPG